MENLLNTTLEAIGVGVLTLIIGHIVFNLSVEKNKRNEIEKIYNNLSLILFLIGFLIHFILELIGLNKWYCDKRCSINLKEISKLKN